MTGNRRDGAEDDRRGREGQPTRQPSKPGSQAPAGTPGTGDALCPVCSGTGRSRRDGGSACPNCNGTGVVTEGIGGG